MTSATLLTPHLIAAAAHPHTVAVAALAGRPLDGPTPCSEWDVRALVQHLLYWSPLLAAAGRRDAPHPPAAEESLVEVGPDWPAALEQARGELVEAWSEPDAWSGTVSLGGPDELPAPMIGGMILGELVVHGWDLARAAGAQPSWPDDVLAAALSAVEGMAEQGREMGIFAPEVAVASDASTLDRIIAVSGRDPGGDLRRR